MEPEKAGKSNIQNRTRQQQRAVALYHESDQVWDDHGDGISQVCMLIFHRENETSVSYQRVLIQSGKNPFEFRIFFQQATGTILG